MKPNSIIVIVSFVVLLVAFWNRNAMPSTIAALPSLEFEPDQRPSDKEDFSVEFNDVNYRVKPQYRYSMTGLVVSYRHHDGNSRMHRRSNDHLNMLDVCVVWGDNADPTFLQRFDFWNGIFSCRVKTNDWDAWNAFDISALANNHLISDDPLIRDQVRKIRVGDQIRVDGWLSSYGTRTGDERGTSITREDTGDGACETIYVDRFRIEQAALNYWRITMWLALGVLLVALLRHFKQPFRPHPGGTD